MEDELGTGQGGTQSPPEPPSSEPKMPRDIYRQVKRMNNDQISAYFRRVWMGAYEQGYRDALFGKNK